MTPADELEQVADLCWNAIPYAVPGDELGHHGQQCSFEAIVAKYGLATDEALVLLGKIVNGADTDNALWQQPQEPGIQAMIREGKPDGAFKN